MDNTYVNNSDENSNPGDDKDLLNTNQQITNIPPIVQEQPRDHTKVEKKLQSKNDINSNSRIGNEERHDTLKSNYEHDLIKSEKDENIKPFKNLDNVPEKPISEEAEEDKDEQQNNFRDAFNNDDYKGPNNK
ncbi:hypothetical protein [Ferruginibacter albus]|uniref:hypothetical protein n=1 Tax=Ferruginibacter albus TaxID=2875540 RepID=UPI001CC7C30B|nr:hypothetical protein [Ferruginibacter albus]UAY53068.1 hypothetical protein K9M53_05165 [Ferruginibacter albus]